MLTGTVFIAAVLAALILAATRVKGYYRLAHVPGPKLMGFTNLVMARKMYSGRMHYGLLDLKKTYGPIVRTGPNMLMVSDPDVIRHMSAARSEYTRGPYYKAVRINPDVDNIFSMTDDIVHKELKSKMGLGYSGRDMGGFEPGVDKQIAALVRLIECKYLSTATEYRPMDLALKCNYFALDVISELGFGAAFGFLAEDRDLYRYNEMTRKFFPFCFGADGR
ncbi:hypothetical protein CDD81_2195 [Ophiocordyceps australis]|uniref:Cytochrome P450 n=1 Tax=Ophiocordyceps australis TaxID=1399860 RepID=A0A2C5XUA0_9HYPO|nr:hypothetical protein CDD81_2195 [Ophiocordyceps australis]